MKQKANIRGIFVNYVFDKRLLFQEKINIEFNKRKQTKIGKAWENILKEDAHMENKPIFLS